MQSSLVSRGSQGRKDSMTTGDRSLSPPSINHHTRRSASISYALSSPTNIGGTIGSSTAARVDPRKNTTSMHNRRPSVPIISIPTKEKSTAYTTTGSIGQVEEHDEDDDEESVMMKAERDDAFMPLTPTKTLPYTVNGSSPSSSPNVPSFPRSGADRAHARQYSRIHERNLSAFFPRPEDKAKATNGYGDTYEDPHGSGKSRGTVEIPKPSNGSVDGDGMMDGNRSAANRRGHHHKHSISHNLFVPEGASEDMRQRSPAFGVSPVSPNSSTSGYSSKSPSHSHAMTRAVPAISPYTRLPSPIRFVIVALRHLPLVTKAGLTLSASQIILGASLWISGQNRESLSVTGLGYLIVFDGIGGLSSVLVEGGKGVEELWELMGSAVVEASVQLPFGNQRVITLSHFSQAIYLLFSAVYVCKESIEHVLLLHGGHGGEDAPHSIVHAGMGHGEGLSSIVQDSGAGISFPVLLLSLSALLSIISAIALRNHAALSRAVGPSSFTASSSPGSHPAFLSLLINPFTLTIVIFSIGLAVSGHLIPAVQLEPLDKVVALLQSLAMFYIAYPAAVATGSILLQTAPETSSSQMKSIANGIRDIENHPLVLSVDPPHIWQLSPHSTTPSSSRSNNDEKRRNSFPASGSSATLIATLEVKVKNDASDADILDITNFCTERLATGLRLSGGRDSSRDDDERTMGELSVSIKRSSGRKIVARFHNNFEESLESHTGHDHGGHSHSSHTVEEQKGHSHHY